MSPAIPSGSLLHLRPLPEWQEFFGYGGVFVLELTDGRRITKQVMGSQLDLKTHVRCVSFNPLRQKGPAKESRDALLRAKREKNSPHLSAGRAQHSMP